MPVKVVCDLRHMFGPARDQGMRPTCMAFAASDAHAAVRPDWAPLSCEFAYYHALRRDGGKLGDGATLRGMMGALRDDGQPPEEVWPYLSTLPANVALWKPPVGANPLYRRAAGHTRPIIVEILQRLDAGAPVILTMCLSPAFYKPNGDGIIAASESPDPKRRHAVIAVGHGQHNGERVFLIRNSWGPSWGIDGYAWLSEAYLAPRLNGLAEMKEDLTNVSAHSNTANVRDSVA